MKSQTSKVKSKKRISWDAYFLKIAELVSERSTCLRIKEGAVLVKDKRILTAGYNGAPFKLPHCSTTGCLRQEKGLKGDERLEVCRGLDAIQNAVIQAAIFGISIKDSVLYVTRVPSITSTKIVINAGIKKIFVTKADGLPPLADSLLKQSKIEMEGIE